MADKMKEHKLLQWLVEKDGTKLANLTLYLKHVWTENPAAKFIIFSQVLFSYFIYLVFMLFYNYWFVFFPSDFI